MAQHRSPDTDAPRSTRRAGTRLGALAGAAALMATVTVVALGEPGSPEGAATAQARSVSSVTPGAGPGSPAAGSAAMSQDATRRELEPVSRSAVRGVELRKPTPLERTMAPAAVRRAVAGADRRRWSTTDLNVYASPAADAARVALLPKTRRVPVTGRTLLGRTEIVRGGRARWVSTGYLAVDKPRPPKPPKPAPRPAAPAAPSAPATSSAPRSSAPAPAPAPAPAAATCSNGTSVPSGVSGNIVKVHQAVCAAFPSITTYGTFRSDGEHAQGLAIDIMISGATGQAVADFVRARSGSLGVSYIIYAQRIWSVQRGGEGWRGMSDRGSTTANHYDHVHVTTY